MEVEDPLSAKFRTLIERLMVATTSEIVKIFSKVLLETRVEITRSWKEIDMLKQHLEKCEQEKREAIIMAQRRDFKREDDEMEVSHFDSLLSDSDIPGAGELGGSAVDVSVEQMHVSLGNAQACQPGTSGEHQVKNSNATAAQSKKTKSPKTKCTQFVARPKMGCPTKVPQVKRQNSTSSHTTPKTVEKGPSASVDELSSSPEAKVVKKEASISTQKRPNSCSVYRALRDRQHLSMQKHCLCCSSDGCNLPSSPFRAQHQVPSVYICRKCERRFKSNLQFKNHKCSMPQTCIKCGQIFTTLQGLFEHSQKVQSPFGCNECDEMFATPCAWTVHKRIHTNLIIPKEIKAKRFEVRLKRISDSQLEAAMLQNNSSNPNHTTIAAETNLGSAGEHGSELAMLNIPETSTTQTLETSDGQSSVRKVYAIMSASSCQIQISGDVRESEPSMVCKNETVTDPNASDESLLSIPPRKRKMAECSHDAYNGVFPVENILKWRNNKGRTEVRVKWMPCTLCGAKFQNTWEPAESFPGYLDDKIEDTKKN